MKRPRKTIDPNLTSAILTLFTCIGLPCASMNLEPPTTDQTIQAELRASLDPASQAMLDSQSGPLAAKIFTILPTSPELTFEPCHFRVLLLRRLRLPTCRCRQPLDPLGDHRAACPRSGALRTRASGMERAAARICREAGASVRMNVLVRDLNTHTTQHDDRRIEVIANGLPLWNGCQLAVDTTLVSPSTAAGQPRRHQGSTAAAALRIARRAKARTYPELTGAGRARLVMLGIETGGRWSEEAVTFIRLLAKWQTTKRHQPHRLYVDRLLWLGLPAGQLSSPPLPCGLSRAVSSCCPPRPRPTWMVLRPP